MALTTFSDLVGEARERIRLDAVAAGLPEDGVPLREGGVGATAYAEAVGVYLAFAKLTDNRWLIDNLSLVRWNIGRREGIEQVFLAVKPSADDLGLSLKATPLSKSTGNFTEASSKSIRMIEKVLD